jgi:hypothetical protein
VRTLWVPVLFANHLVLKFKLKIQDKNLFADVFFEIYVKTPVSTLVNP